MDVAAYSHDNPLGVIRECMRVLKPNGTILIRYGAIEQIRHDVIHTFFPDVLVIDEQRTPTRPQVEEWLEKAGFFGIVSEGVIQQTYKNSGEQLHATQGKCTSILNMISDKSFETGIRNLIQYIDQNPTDPWLLFDKMTLTVGYKGNKEIA